jgi:hypothetical protein
LISSSFTKPSGIKGFIDDVLDNALLYKNGWNNLNGERQAAILRHFGKNNSTELFNVFDELIDIYRPRWSGVNELINQVEQGAKDEIAGSVINIISRNGESASDVFRNLDGILDDPQAFIDDNLIPKVKSEIKDMIGIDDLNPNLSTREFLDSIDQRYQAALQDGADVSNFDQAGNLGRYLDEVEFRRSFREALEGSCL